MKNFYYLLTYLLLLVSCSDDGSTFPQANTDPDPINVVDDPTIVINEETDSGLTDITPDKLIFDIINDQTQSFKPGAIIVSDMTDNAPNGYLRKVISVQENAGIITVNTTQATLGEAIRNCDFELDFTIDASSIIGETNAKGDYKKYTQENKQASGNITVNLANLELFKNSTGDEITADFKGSFKFDNKFILKIKDKNVEEFELSQVSNVILDVDLVAKLNSGEDLNIETNPLKTFNLVPFTILVLGIPIPVANQKIVLKAGLDGKIEATLSVGASLNGTFKNGMSYVSGSWRNIDQDPVTSFNFKRPNVAFSGEMHAYLKPSYELSLYGIPTGNLALFSKTGPQLKAEVSSSSQTPSYGLDWCTALGAASELNILNIEGDFKFNKQSPSLCFDIADWGEEPTLEVPNSLDFGLVLIEKSKDLQIQIMNVSSVADVAVSAINVPDGFNVNWGNGTIRRGEIQEVQVSFSPTEVKSYNSRLEILYGPDNKSTAVELIASGIEEAALELSGTLDFGEQVLETVKSIDIDLKNISISTDITVSDLKVPEGFTLNWTSGIIKPGEIQKVTVTFTPTEAKSYSGQLEVVYGDNNTSQSLEIKAAGISDEGDLELSGALEFGEVFLKVNAALNIEMTNTNIYTDINVSAINVPDGFNLDWSGGTLKPGEIQKVTVTFTPTEAKSYSGQLEVVYGPDDVSKTIGIVASGIEEDILELAGDLNFGEILLGQQDTRDLEMKNTNIFTDITVSSISVPEGFSLDWNGGAIKPGEIQKVQVLFNPSDVKSYNGQLKMIYGKDEKTANIEITAEGIEEDVLEFSGDLVFDNVEIGKTATRGIGIKNANVASTIEITSIKVPEGYTVNWEAGIILAGDVQQVEVSFSPLESKAYNGELEVLYGSDNTIKIMDITGQGIPTVLNYSLLAASELSQLGSPGENLDKPIGVRVVDQSGAGVADVEVYWETDVGSFDFYGNVSGAASPGVSYTDSDGYAYTNWALGDMHCGENPAKNLLIASLYGKDDQYMPSGTTIANNKVAFYASKLAISLSSVYSPNPTVWPLNGSIEVSVGGTTLRWDFAANAVTGVDPPCNDCPIFIALPNEPSFDISGTITASFDSPMSGNIGLANCSYDPDNGVRMTADGFSINEFNGTVTVPFRITR